MPPRIGLIASVLASAAALWTADLFLARTERAEVRAEARHAAEQGGQLLASGHPAEAVRKAQALDRGNTGYALQLAEALLAAGKLDEAGTTLAAVLEASPNDGRANLLEARLMVRRGEPNQAEAYYHRAIFGIWPGNSQVQRIRVRLELANLLASIKSNQELIAELIPLEDEARRDPAVLGQVAHLYAAAGAPDRAVAAYRALIRQDPGDARNYAGLGEAELALGNYREAQSAFQNAVRRGADAGPRLELAARLLNLDPTPRSLTTAAKFARATEILEMARDALARCPAAPGAPKLLAGADAALAAKIRGPVTNEMAEARLAAAQTLWESRGPGCPAGPGDEALSLIMKKLAE